MQIKIGDRIECFLEPCPCVNACQCGEKLKRYQGKVMYMEYKHIHFHEFLPIQVELDEPYDDDGQQVIRISLLDIPEHRFARLKRGQPLFIRQEIHEEEQAAEQNFNTGENGQLSLF